jgi:predicted GNAT family acetyltransferase
MDFQKETNRLFAEDADGKLVAELTFPEVSEGVVDIDHTFVDNSLGGQGVGGQLLEAAYDLLKEDGRKATLTCPFAVDWFSKHPEKGDILVP